MSQRGRSRLALWCASWQWLLFAPVSLLCGLAQALPGGPTDDAFAALLSMPGAEPSRGSWNTPVPEDFAERDESHLVRYLAQKKSAGADFDARRHFGTLLHHAIRAGLTRTARWLMAHGSDPRRREQLYVDGNALDLAIKYQRAALIKDLRKYYQLSPINPAASSRRAESIYKPAARTIRQLLVDAAQRKLHNDIPSNMRESALSARQIWNAAKDRLKPTALAALLDNDKSLADWVRLHGSNADRLAEALSAMPESILKRHSSAVLLGMLQAAKVVSREGLVMNYPVPPQSWRTVWRVLGPGLNYSRLTDLAKRQ